MSDIKFFEIPPKVENPKSLEEVFAGYCKRSSMIEVLEYFSPDPKIESQLKHFLLRKLEAMIPVELQRQIEAASGKRFLLAGNDTKLMENVGCFAHCLRGENTFHFYDLSGKSKSDQFAMLNNQNEHFYSGGDRLRKGGAVERLKMNCSVFLLGLKLEDGLDLEKFEKEIRNLKTGLLIVSTKDDIPPYFKSLFEVINLEPEKQPIPEPLNTEGKPDATTKKQGIPTKKKRINKLFYTFDDKDRIKLSSNCNYKPIMLTRQERKLFLFLKEDRKTPDEIIEHIWNSYKPKDLRVKRKNVKELRGRLNRRCSEIGVEKLISELIDECYCLTVEAVER